MADFGTELGDKLAASITEFFNEKENLRALDSLKKLGLSITNPEYTSGEARKGPLEGMTIVITGALSRPRNEYEELIERNGGRAAGSVSKKTSFVLAGSEAGSKLDKAKELGVRVIDETAFLKMIEGA